MHRALLTARRREWDDFLSRPGVHRGSLTLRGVALSAYTKVTGSPSTARRRSA